MTDLTPPSIQPSVESISKVGQQIVGCAMDDSWIQLHLAAKYVDEGVISATLRQINVDGTEHLLKRSGPAFFAISDLREEQVSNGQAGWDSAIMSVSRASLTERAKFDISFTYPESSPS